MIYAKFKLKSYHFYVIRTFRATQSIITIKNFALILIVYPDDEYEYY
ncbi:hypothetical protein BOVA604_972 [Bacteroides ovatus]|nr:hypothetical protein BOVA604_972 [Bacteroides ovatus]